MTDIDQPPDQAPDQSPEQPPERPENGELPSIGTVIEQRIERELHDSYLTYAMSTITDRALPDVRDGLKPSQRRILVAMNDLNLSPGRKHRKCAKIAGDTSGNYHPHGEGVIYPTLVHMGQDWKMRVLLVDKQGNFGSIDGDPPAAMRYTEARMTAAAVELMADLKLDTVDYRPNYDETRKEPTVLPARLPNLLVNGSSGIAVGMSCSMPPHNAGEILDAIIEVIDNPELDLQGLMQIVPGPDFPTGGIIKGRRGIAAAYAAGRGRISLTGRIEREKIGKREALIITEIPYQLVQNNLIEKIVDAARGGRIPDISDIKNFSGKNHRTRIVVYLKKNANPDVVERQLFKFTPLQSTYSIINIALVNGHPRTLTLRQLIDCFIDHRRDVIRRRTEHLLREAKKQAHRLEGLIYAVCEIDAVIALIRASRSREEAIVKLVERRFQIPADHEYAPQIPQQLITRSNEGDGVALTRAQAEAIGALRLIQLVGLEIERLTGEYTVLLEQINEYEGILADEQLILDMIKEDCRELRKRFATDRLTAIEVDELEDFDLGDLTPEHSAVVTISNAGYAKRLHIDTYREQRRGGRGVKGSDAREGDFIEHIFVSSTHDDLLCFTNTGRVFRKKVYEIPEGSRIARGRAIVNLLNLREGERVVAFRTIDDFLRADRYLFFATAQGRVKRTRLEEYRNVHRAGINAIRLNEGDDLIGVVLTKGEDDVLLGTARGMAIRFREDDCRPMGRVAAGVKGIGLQSGDEVVGIVRAIDGQDLLTITEHGYGKRTEISAYLVQSEDGSTRRQGRGGKGRLDIRTTSRNGKVIAIRCVQEDDGLIFMSEGGMVVRVAASSISRIGRNTQGVRLVNLKENDRLITAARVVDSGENGGDTSAAEPAASPAGADEPAPS